MGPEQYHGLHPLEVRVLAREALRYMGWRAEAIARLRYGVDVDAAMVDIAEAMGVTPPRAAQILDAGCSWARRRVGRP